jgi:hypothetical protein
MDIFQNEQTRVEKRINEVLPQLEDIGARGLLISKHLYETKNAVKYPKSRGHGLLGSDIHKEDIDDKFGQIKAELSLYSENSGSLIRDLSKILTEIRYIVVVWNLQ